MANDDFILFKSKQSRSLLLLLLAAKKTKRMHRRKTIYKTSHTKSLEFEDHREASWIGDKLFENVMANFIQWNFYHI